jgi:hypothetical protein
MKKDDQELGANELIQAGKLLFGDRWKEEMKTALGLSDARRIRQWLTPQGQQSYRPIPPGVWGDIKGLLEQRKLNIDELISKIQSK